MHSLLRGATKKPQILGRFCQKIFGFLKPYFFDIHDPLDNDKPERHIT